MPVLIFRCTGTRLPARAASWPGRLPIRGSLTQQVRSWATHQGSSASWRSPSSSMRARMPRRASATASSSVLSARKLAAPVSSAACATWQRAVAVGLVLHHREQLRRRRAGLADQLEIALEAARDQSRSRPGVGASVGSAAQARLRAARAERLRPDFRGSRRFGRSSRV